MSRIGKMPITVPAGVIVTTDAGGLVKVKGPKGELSRTVSPDITFSQEGDVLTVTRPTDNDRHRAQHGLTRTLVANMVQGVSVGFTRVLNVTGVGYRAAVEAGSLVLNVGYSHPVALAPRTGITFSVVQDPGTRMPIITVEGIDKEVVGQMASEVRKVRKPEPYKGKGIRYSDEIIRRKAGKSAKAGKGGGGKGAKK